MRLIDHSPLYLIWQTINDTVHRVSDASSSENSAQSLLCPSWRSFDGFKAWAKSNGYQNGLYLARIDPDQSYAPENCYWCDALPRGKNSPKIINAFGMNKSISAWAKDPRCTVDNTTLRHRLRHGWEAERAIMEPPAPSKRHSSGATPSTIKIGAIFGQLTVIGACQFGRDKKNKPTYSYMCHCSCGEEALIDAFNLLYSGKSSCGCKKREATRLRWTTHGESKTRLYAQWQSTGKRATELKATLADDLPVIDPAWAADYPTFRDWALAHDYANDKYLIRLDKAKGYAEENCQWVERRTLVHYIRDIPEYHAFDESKSLTYWVEDPRCLCSYEVLTRRIQKGWDFEKALITPQKHTPKRLLTAFSETKPYHAWSRDPRCVVSKSTLDIRLREGWTLEKALTTPRSMPLVQITAFGITKPLLAWVSDSRCKVDAMTFRARLNAEWKAEKAITTAPETRPALILNAWDEQKCQRGWLNDPRCVVSLKTLKKRLKEGWQAEEALSTPVEDVYGEKLLTAFGETKSLLAWLKDERCRVSRDQLTQRLDREWAAERAIGTPPVEKVRHPSGYTVTTIPPGAQFGRLTVTGPFTRIQYPSKTYGYLYPCSCSCGTTEHIVSAYNLLNNQVSSCGCIKREKRGLARVSPA